MLPRSLALAAVLVGCATPQDVTGSPDAAAVDAPPATGLNPLASLPNAGARVVARALQRYGMFLSDGGNVALTARSDHSTRARWGGTLGPRDLAAVRPGDFERIDGGTRDRFTGDCVRLR